MEAVLMSTDAIVYLKRDHANFKKLFRKYNGSGDGALATKAQLVDQMLEALTIHTYLENEVMYPQVRELVPDLEDDILESYEEHHVADVLCTEIAALDPSHERFDAKVAVLIEIVEHHVEEEEDEWFPKVRAALGRKQLQEIGLQMEERRAKAPTSPSRPGALKKALKGMLA
jgi:hemerythrin superfamily protein